MAKFIRVQNSFINLEEVIKLFITKCDDKKDWTELVITCRDGSVHRFIYCYTLFEMKMAIIEAMRQAQAKKSVLIQLEPKILS